MENLLDKAIRTDKNVLIKQIAEMKTYRISVYCSIFFFNICCFLLHLVGKFNEKAGAHAKTTSYRTLKQEMMDTAKYINTSGTYPNAFVDITIRLIRSALLFLTGKSKNADERSAKIIRAASKILYPGEIKGKSIYEISDLVYKRYPDRKKHGPLFFLRLWLILSCMLFIGFFALIILTSLSLLPVFLIFIVSETACLLFFSRKLAIWHLAKLVWLIISETGSTEAEHYDNEQSKNNDEMTGLFELRMRTLHSLLYSASILAEDDKKNKSAISAYKEQIKSNDAWITAHEKEQSADNKRIIEGKKEENRLLSEQIMTAEEKSAGITAECERSNSLIYSLLENLIPLFKKRWEASYDRLNITDAAAKSIVCFYSVEEIKLIEKRFYELNHTADPSSISKKKNGICYVPFLTASGMDARIGFVSNDMTGNIDINYIERSDTLTEHFVSEGEMIKAMQGLTIPRDDKQLIQEINNILQEYEHDRLRWSGEKKALENKVSGLLSEESRLRDELSEKQSSIDDLTKLLEDEEEKCRKLQLLIDNYNSSGDKKNAQQLSAVLEDTRDKLAKLQEEYDKRVKEIDTLYAELVKTKDSLSQLEQELLKKEKEILEAQKELDHCNGVIEKNKTEIAALEEEKIQNKNQIVTLNGVINAAESRSQSDQNTINKLRDSKTALEGKNRELERTINEKNYEIQTISDDKNRLDSFLASKNEEIKKLNDTIKNSTIHILYNKEIYDMLDCWILKAQKYIYIISPFLSRRQVKDIKEKLIQATRSNPDLKIKILYGMKDKNYKASEQDEERLLLARELISEIQEALGSRVRCKESNTHVKLTLMDDSDYMIGSANLLSFSGKNYNNTIDTHDELSICAKDKNTVQRLKDKYFNW